MLRKELNIHTFNDLLNHFPLRHIDKTKVDTIASLSSGQEYAYVAGILLSMDLIGEGRSRRLVGKLKDNTGIIELVWFQGINFVEKILHPGNQYLLFGKLGFFMGMPQIAHPEIENFAPQKMEGKNSLEPIYPATEKLKSRGLNGNNIRKFTAELFTKISEKDLPENLPKDIIDQFKLKPKILFLIDGLGALLTAFFLFVILRTFNEYFGMLQTTLTYLSLIAVIFCLYSITCFFLLSDNWKPFLRVISIANLLYWSQVPYWA